MSEFPQELASGWSAYAAAKQAVTRLVRGPEEAAQVATFGFILDLSPRDRQDAARHLEESALRMRSQYRAGQVHPPTEAVVDCFERIAAAVAGGGEGREAKVSVHLDTRQCLQVRRALRASWERAGDQRAVREAVGVIADAWERHMGYRPGLDRAEGERAPSEALAEGGWRSMRGGR